MNETPGRRSDGPTTIPDVVLRIHLAGRMTLMRGDIVVEQRDLPGALGRALLAVLVLRRSPVRRSELADLLGRDTVEWSTWDATLNSTLSRVRVQLHRLGLDGRDWLQATGGTVEFCRPAPVVVDVESARAAIDRADVLWRAGAADTAWAEATVAYSVAARPFLPNVSGLWAEQVQDDLDEIRRRALRLIVESCLVSGDLHQARVAAVRVVRDEPLNEEHHRLLIRVHLAAGDRARARRALDDLERLMRNELAEIPSASTLDLLR